MLGLWRSDWPVNKSSRPLLAAVSLSSFPLSSFQPGADLASYSTRAVPGPHPHPEELNCFITATQMLNHEAVLKINPRVLHCTMRPRASASFERGVQKGTEMRSMSRIIHQHIPPLCICACVRTVLPYVHTCFISPWNILCLTYSCGAFSSEAVWLFRSLRSVSSCDEVSILSGFHGTH